MSVNWVPAIPEKHAFGNNVRVVALTFRIVHRSGYNKRNKAKKVARMEIVIPEEYVRTMGWKSGVSLAVDRSTDGRSGRIRRAVNGELHTRALSVGPGHTDGVGTGYLQWSYDPRRDGFYLPSDSEIYQPENVGVTDEGILFDFPVKNLPPQYRPALPADRGVVRRVSPER